MEFEKLPLEVVDEGKIVLMASLILQTELVHRIKDAQKDDPDCKKIKERMSDGRGTDFRLSNDDCFTMETLSLCVPLGDGLRKEIMNEAHQSLYTVHLGSTKMYKDLKTSYWWNNMKRDVAQFVEQCSTCQQVKAKHQRPASTL
jgi:hypothetical protein